MNSAEYIDKVRETKGLDSDYKVNKLLGWPTNRTTRYREGVTLDNESSRQIAEILDIPVWQVIADMEIQRAKDEPTKKAWKMLSKLSKETGKINPNLLILQGVFSFASVAFYILCKIAHGQDYVQLRSEYELA